MNREKMKIITLLLSTGLLLFACERMEQGKSEPNTVHGEDEPGSGSRQQGASHLFARLKSGDKIGSFLSDPVIFIFHSDDRCDGSTDGTVSELPSGSIDSPFKMRVINDGKGWACEEKQPSSYEMEFDLKKQLAQWDRFEMDEYDVETNSFYIHGKGESDYMVIYFRKEDHRNIVYKMEYRSEDPG